MARQEPGEPYLRIDSEEANTILESDGDRVVVVDVRREDEWLTGHVKGAMHIPIDDLMERVNELPHDKKLLFICAIGVRSGLGCEFAAAAGYSPANIYNVDDGTPTWIEKKLPTSYGNEP